MTVTNPLVIGLRNKASDHMDAARNTHDKQIGKAHNQASYLEGKSVAYTDAAIWAMQELERLKVEFQNGCLNIDSFQIGLR